MATLKELQEKRENKLIEIASIRHDLKEYTNYPCESVDIEQIKYQYGFVFNEIKQIDNQIKTIILSEMESLSADFKNLKTLLEIEQKKTSVLVSELPEKKPNMFKELLTIPQIKDKLKDFDYDWSVLKPYKF